MGREHLPILSHVHALSLKSWLLAGIRRVVLKTFLPRLHERKGILMYIVDASAACLWGQDAVEKNIDDVHSISN